MTILLGIIAAMGAVIGFLFTKKQNAEAVNQNVEVKQEINQSNQQVVKDQGLLEAEAVKRQQIVEQSQKQSNASMQSIKDMEDFLNRDPSKHE